MPILFVAALLFAGCVESSNKELFPPVKYAEP